MLQARNDDVDDDDDDHNDDVQVITTTVDGLSQLYIAMAGHVNNQRNPTQPSPV